MEGYKCQVLSTPDIVPNHKTNKNFISRIFLNLDHELNIGFGCKANQAINVMKTEMYKDCADRMNA